MFYYPYIHIYIYYSIYTNFFSDEYEHIELGFYNISKNKL